MKYLSAILLTFGVAGFAFGQNEQAPITEKPFAYRDWTYRNISGGGETNLRQFARGKKLVMVVHWAPWCPNWVHDVAFVQSLHERYKDRGLGIIGVGVYDPLSSMRSHIERNKLGFPMVYETEDRAARLTSVHFRQRTEAGDTRKWGSPWYVLLDAPTLEPAGDMLTKRTTVVNGELIKQDAERYIQQKLGLQAAAAAFGLAGQGKIEACEPEKKIAELKKP